MHNHNKSQSHLPVPATRSHQRHHRNHRAQLDWPAVGVVRVSHIIQRWANGSAAWQQKEETNTHKFRPGPSANPCHDHSTPPQPFPLPYRHSISNLSARRVVRTSSVTHTSGSSSKACGHFPCAVLRERWRRTQTEHIQNWNEFRIFLGGC
jgi:hypothetical protein